MGGPARDGDAETSPDASASDDTDGGDGVG
jgi:hypothetical protein